MLLNDCQRSQVDKTLFIKKSESKIILVQVYVDDIIFGSTNDLLCQDFVSAMQGEFEMSMMGELNYFLVLQIKHMKTETFLSQTKYCRDVLRKFEMENYKEASTPISKSCYLDADENETVVVQTKFKGLIRSLLYFTASRPDIMFSVCICARFEADPKESHYNATKRILKYLKGTTNVGLLYLNEATLNLKGYSDLDFARCKLDRKSTSGTCYLLGASLISWNNKKQACVALSTAEVEFIAAGSNYAQISWLEQQLSDFGLKVTKAPLFCDNTNAINLTKNIVYHSRTKYRH